ncbi:MAG: hypothetical protein EOM85_02890 [Candidatus Moranbacteria bacterium]|nr:hypothetical protein [Candidatus Moranbacteria bacterium]
MIDNKSRIRRGLLFCEGSANVFTQAMRELEDAYGEDIEDIMCFRPLYDGNVIDEDAITNEVLDEIEKEAIW